MENLIKKLNDLKENIVRIKAVLNIDKKKTQWEELNILMSQNDFWSDNDVAVKISQKAENLKSEISRFEEIEEEIGVIEELALLANEYEDDSVCRDVEDRFKEVEKKFKDLEFLLLFSEELDNSGAILSIHAGSGGVDAQDWAEILERMYLRFCDKMGFKVEILDRVIANEAGIKNSVLRVSGAYAYGYLKSENGVHRLVRISPFDAEAMRHTSFAGVEVIPEIKDDDLIKIDDSDLKIDTYKSSGPGGQGVNTTDSAIRIIHLPTNISVTCQSERSQHQNKAKAMEILRSKLYKLQQEEDEASVKKIKGDAGQGTWGKQIRSYVFQPYQMVKDHRTNFSTNRVDDVINGELHEFMEAYLNFLLKNKNK
ncbi:MAG: peptide chain release factor 2 [Patescibacteria group bacterium]|nr:peptide chain release factor 2 [Patescibacteria group bacterium]